MPKKFKNERRKNKLWRENSHRKRKNEAWDSRAMSIKEQQHKSEKSHPEAAAAFGVSVNLVGVYGPGPCNLGFRDIIIK